MTKPTTETIEIEDLQSLIGEECDQLCPDCGNGTFIDKHQTRWCRVCAWSTDSDLTKFSLSIGFKEYKP